MSPEGLKEFIAEKKKNFAELKSQLNLKNAPLVAVVLDNELTKAEQKALTELIEGCKQLKLNIVVLSDSKLVFANRNAHNLPYNQKNRHKLISAADMALTFDWSDTEELLMHGTIPIASRNQNTLDYNPNAETGNSFIYQHKNAWSIFAALVRALETYKFPYDWRHIIKQGLKRASV